MIHKEPHKRNHIPAPIGLASPLSETTKDLAAELLRGWEDLQSEEGEDVDWFRTAGHSEQPQREKRRKASWDLHRGDVRALGM